MLNVVTFDEALQITEEKLYPLFSSEKEYVELYSAVGRILAEDVFGSDDSPAFDRSTMDGFALFSADSFGAGESIPSMLETVGSVNMGEKTSIHINRGECAAIPTGGMLPSGADCVVPVEYTDCEGSFCLVYKACTPGENVTKKGDDIKKGETLLRAGRRLTVSDIGALAANGNTRISVRKRASVGIISSGDELIPACDTPEIGQIRDVNSYILNSLVKESGCEVKLYGIVKDDFQSLFEMMKKAVGENDAVLISGGSSAGQKDETSSVISSLGELYVHGIAVKPGKPTIIGKIGNTPVFGLPGHPAACCFVSNLLVKPMLLQWNGLSDEKLYSEYSLSVPVSSNHGREEFLCVKTENGEALPLYGKSGIISLLSKSDGYIRIPRNTEGLKKGDTVKVYRL